MWQDGYTPIPSRPLIFMVVFVLVGLCSDLGLQVPDQLRCGFTGEVFKAGNLEAGKHLSNVCFLIVCSSVSANKRSHCAWVAVPLPPLFGFDPVSAGAPLGAFAATLPLPLPSGNTGAGCFAASFALFQSLRRPRGTLLLRRCIRRLSRRSAAPELWPSFQPIQPASLPVLHLFDLTLFPCH